MPIILLIGLALVLPFLNYMRFPPVPDWWTDALVIVTISAALLWSGGRLVFKRSKSYSGESIQQITALPVAFIFGICWLIYVQLSPYIINQPLYPLRSMGIVFGLVAGLLIYRVSQAKSLVYVLNILSMIVLFGVMLQVCIGFTQALGLAPMAGGFLMYDQNFPQSSIMGNLAQRNQFAHYLGWGLIVCCYLYSNKKLSKWLVLPCIAAIALLMAWSTSRLVLAYGFGFAIFTLYWRFRNKHDDKLERFAKAAMWVVIAIALTQLFTGYIAHFLQWLGLPIENLGSGASRVTESGIGARRRVEWEKAWQIFLQHPWFGVGLGGYPYQSMWLDTYGGYPSFLEQGLFTHCHNLVMQLLAETGVVGTLLAGVGITWCGGAFFRKGQQNSENLLLASLLMITLIHSLFEYPLWYLPFFTGFMIFLSLSPAKPLSLSVRPRMQALMSFVLGGVGLIYFATGIPIANKLIHWQMYPTRSEAEFVQRMQAVNRLSLNPFWAYEADSMQTSYVLTSRKGVTESNIELLSRVTAYRPYPAVILRLSVLRAYEGKQKESEDLLLMMLAGQPLYTPWGYDALMSASDSELKQLQVLITHANSLYKTQGPEAVVRWVNIVQKERGYTR